MISLVATGRLHGNDTRYDCSISVEMDRLNVGLTVVARLNRSKEIRPAIDLPTGTPKGEVRRYNASKPVTVALAFGFGDLRVQLGEYLYSIGH